MLKMSSFPVIVHDERTYSHCVLLAVPPHTRLQTMPLGAVKLKFHGTETEPTPTPTRTFSPTSDPRRDSRPARIGSRRGSPCRCRYPCWSRGINTIDKLQFLSFGPFYGAIAVPYFTRSRCGHCQSPGVATVARRLRYSYRPSWLRLILIVVSTVATPGEWQYKIRTSGMRQLAVANGPNIFQMLLVYNSIKRPTFVYSVYCKLTVTVANVWRRQMHRLSSSTLSYS